MQRSNAEKVDDHFATRSSFVIGSLDTNILIPNWKKFLDSCIKFDKTTGKEPIKCLVQEVMYLLEVVEN